MNISTERSLGKLRISSRHMGMEKAYWAERLKGFVEKTGFPYDLTGDADEFQFRNFLLDRVTSEHLFKVAKDSEHSLLALLMVAVNILLHRYGGLSEICVGATVYPRTEEDEAVNRLIAVRFSIDENMPVRNVIREYANAYRQDMKHQQYPLEVLFEDLGYSQEGANPLFDVVVGIDDGELPELFGRIPAQMTLQFKRDPEGLRGLIGYNASLYKESTIDQIWQHLCTILGGLLRGPDNRVSEISMLTDAEIQDIFRECVSAGEEQQEEMSLGALIERQAIARPGKIALHQGAETCTYHRLLERADAWAKELLHRGVSPGSLVGVMMEPSIDLVVGIMAILRAGCAYVPIDSAYPVQRKEFIFKDSGIGVLLTGKKGMEETKGIMPHWDEKKILCIDGEDPVVQSGSSRELPVVVPDQVAYVIYTSGTTGNPKGVVITHRNVVHYLTWAQRAYLRGEPCCFPFFTSVSFDLTVTALFLPLITGNTIRVYRFPKGEAALRQIILENEVDSIKITPSHLKILREIGSEEGFAGQKMRRFIVGGENFETSLAMDIYRLFGKEVEIYNEYGPTETTVGCMIHRFDPLADTGASVPIGFPIDDTEIYLLDESRRFVPRGVAGEIYIGGKGLGSGYLNNEELTRKKFTDHLFSRDRKLYRTGDLARRLPNGALEFIGRKDTQVKVNGYRIELEEIRIALGQFPGIKDVLVRAIKTNGGVGDQLCAYYVAGEAIVPEQLSGFLEARLPSFMVPSVFIHLSGIPLTVNGKPDVSALPDPAVPHSGPAALPETEMETFLIEILRDILKVGEIGIDDNIFKLGMDSIRTIRLGAIIQKKLQIRPEIAEFYDFPVIRQLALQLEQKWRQKGNDDPETINALTRYSIIKELQDFRQRQEPLLSMKVAAGSIEDLYPMSEIEKAMTYYTILDSSEPMYLEQNTYDISYVDFNIDLFKEALAAMFKKHPTLRTGYDLENFIHIVYKEYSPPVSFQDLSDWTAEAQDEWFGKYRREHRRASRDLLVPTLKCSIFKIQQHQHLFMLEFHHAVMDGWSLHAFLVELNSRYVALVSGEEFIDQPVHCSFRENIIQEWEAKKDPDLDSFWKNELTGYKRYVFPGRHTGKARKDVVLVQARRRPAYIQELRDYCAGEGISLRTLCFAAYMYVLYLFSNEEDILAGQVTHTRPLSEDGEKLLGCFLNTIPVRVKMDASQTVREYLTSFDQRLNAIKKFEKISLLSIKDRVGETSSGQNPFFDTKFNFIDFHVIHEMDWDGLDRNPGRNLPLDNFTLENTHCDLCIDLTGGMSFTATWAYSPHYVDPETVERLSHYFMATLDLFVADPEILLHKRNFLSEQEQALLLDGLNATEVVAPPAGGILQLFKEKVLSGPGEVAIEDQAGVWTRERLDSESGKFAAALAGRGVGPRDIVALLMERSAEMMVAIFGVLKTGAAYLPLPVDTPDDRIRLIIEESGARCLVTNTDRRLDDLATIVRVGEEAAGGMAKEWKDRIPDPQDPAYVIYTSGSTGRPKGVVIEHQALLTRLLWLQREYPTGAGDRILQKTTYAFDISLLEIFGWVAGGASLYQLPPGDEKDPGRILAAIREQRINVVHFVPSLFRLFLDHIEDTLVSTEPLRAIFFSGEALKPDDVNRFRAVAHRRVDMVNLYGPTEATIGTTCYLCPGDETLEAMSIGKPIDDTKIYILDRQLELQPVGVFGDIYIAGGCLAKEYLNRPDLTAEKFIANPMDPSRRMYRSGDIGRWLPDGNIEFTGRADHQVKIRGFRIEPGEIEIVLTESPLVSQAVVVPKEDAVGNLRLIAYVVAAGEIEDNAVYDWLRTRLPSYMLPDLIQQLPALPLLNNGKVDRKALPDPGGRGRNTTKYLAPRNETESMLVGIWEGLLDRSPIGVQDSFFELGGNSLLAISLTNQVNRCTGTTISFQLIFEVLTIEGMAEKMQSISALIN